MTDQNFVTFTYHSSNDQYSKYRQLIENNLREISSLLYFSDRICLSRTDIHLKLKYVKIFFQSRSRRSLIGDSLPHDLHTLRLDVKMVLKFEEACI